MNKREKPFHLDMSFDEALKRVAQTDPQQLSVKEKLTKGKRRKTKKSISDSGSIESTPQPKAP